LGDNSGNGAYLNGTTDITDGNWHHIVAIRDASNNEIGLYVDGVKEASTTKTFGDFVSTSPINIGWLNLSTGYHFIGSVDELAVYNRVLSNAEIQQHYQQSGYCVITHTITATAGSGGSISPSGTVTVVQGADQIFTIMPDSGYHISDVKIDGVSIGPVPSYKFTNVIGDHTISAYFSINQGSLQGFVYDALFPNKPIVNAKIDLASSYTEYSDSTGFYRFLNLPAGTYDITASALRYTPGIINGITVTDGGTTIQDIALTCNVSFTDIPSGYWAEDYIKSMYCKEITNGCSTNPLMYCPENTVSRASLAVFIIRAMGESPSSAPYNAYFDDIANDRFAPYINRLWELGITAGCGPRLFCPSNVVRRAPLAVLIIRAMGKSPSSAPYNAYFDDIANDWFAPYINRLWELGITAGCGPRLFCPSNVVRRAPLAVLIIKAF
jgi:hypothetical protein